MLTSGSVVQNWLLRYASNLRFPRLLAVAAVLFFIDLLVPDPLPLLDEVLLGLISLLLASLKKRGGEMSRTQGPRMT
jgi:hypothetical protein